MWSTYGNSQAQPRYVPCRPLETDIMRKKSNILGKYRSQLKSQYTEQIISQGISSQSGNNQTRTSRRTSLAKDAGEACRRIYEIAVYFGDLRKWVKGVDEKTTCEEVIKAILAESRIDIDCASEYYLVIEDERSQKQSVLQEADNILPHWEAISKSKESRLALTTQRFYVNVEKKDDGSVRSNGDVMTRAKMFTYLNGQMSILDQQQKRLAMLDHELKTIRETSVQEKPTIEVDKLGELSRYEELSSILTQKSKQMRKREGQLNVDKDTGKSLMQMNKMDLYAELRKVEQTGRCLNEQLCGLQAAERELERLLALKRRHFDDVEHLISTRASINNPDESDATRTNFNASSKKVERIGNAIDSVPLMKGRTLSATKGLGDCTRFASNIEDDDSDTGVSSMNSDDNGIPVLPSGQLLKHNIPSDEKYAQLETLV